MVTGFLRGEVQHSLGGAQPAQDVARVLRDRGQLAGGQVELEQVDEIGMTPVQLSTGDSSVRYLHALFHHAGMTVSADTRSTSRNFAAALGPGAQPLITCGTATDFRPSTPNSSP